MRKRVVIIFIIAMLSVCVIIANTKKVKLREIKLLEQLVIGKEAFNEKILFHEPADIKIKNSNIYVLDTPENRVLKFDRDGNFILSIGRKGQGPGELNLPRGFVITNNKIFIANTENRRIEVFNEDGFYETSFKLPGEPNGIVVDKKGYLYIHFPYKNFLLHKYREAGTFVKSMIPASDVKDSLLQMFYNHIVIDINNDELFVAYKFLNKIEKYDTEGNLIWTTQRPLVQEYEPPKRLIKNGMIRMVADALTLNIACNDDILYVLTFYDPNDNKVICDRIDNKGRYVDSFYIPIPAAHLTFDSKGSIYIINSEEATIHKFKILP